MVCPIKNLAKLLNPTMQKLYTDDCTPNECAWWDTHDKQCCIKTLSKLDIKGGINSHPY